MNASSRRSAAFSTRCTSVDDMRRLWATAPRLRGVDEIGADAVAEFVPHGPHRACHAASCSGVSTVISAATGVDDALPVFLVDRFGARVTPLP